MHAGLGDDATIEDAREAIVEGNPFFLAREPWEGFAAVLRVAGGAVREVRLLPLDLGFDRPLPVRGKPRLADAALGRRIVDRVAELSRPYGTAVRYLEGENAGVVELGRGRPGGAGWAGRW